jgi:hypothetical protein
VKLEPPDAFAVLVEELLAVRPPVLPVAPPVLPVAPPVLELL